jgi:predicted nuclease of restriction endonuclease-like (RecB) superfamily
VVTAPSPPVPRHDPGGTPISPIAKRCSRFARLNGEFSYAESLGLDPQGRQQSNASQEATASGIWADAVPVIFALAGMVRQVADGQEDDVCAWARERRTLGHARPAVDEGQASVRELDALSLEVPEAAAVGAQSQPRLTLRGSFAPLLPCRNPTDFRSGPRARRATGAGRPPIYARRSVMSQLPDLPPDYEQFLTAIKERVRAARLRALAAANQELLRGYWEIGSEILHRQQTEGWGSKVIDRLAADLRATFPGVKGFSSRSLKYMRAFAAAWPEGPFVQGGLAQISWYHHLALLDKLDDPELRTWYGTRAARHGWSRDVLVYQIESQLHARQGRALTNFDRTLPPAESDLAQSLSKSPYLFEWLGLDERAAEADVERGLVAQVERFLLEMGDGFALVGRQHHLEVASQDFYLDCSDSRVIPRTLEVAV